jgi:hypothetical protein
VFVSRHLDSDLPALHQEDFYSTRELT